MINATPLTKLLAYYVNFVCFLDTYLYLGARKTAERGGENKRTRKNKTGTREVKTGKIFTSQNEENARKLL